MDLQSVIAGNKARQALARELNKRAGQNVFPVLDQAGMTDFLRSTLGGARRVSEIQNIAASLLPPLDVALQVKVREENPDEIVVLGSNLAVEYREPYYGTVYPPRVKLSDEVVKANGWISLPDEGIKLPGGRAVEVVISFGWSATLADTSIPQLKVKVREHLNREQWEKWSKPTIEVPDMTADDAVVPFTVQSYGTCVVTGQALVAYGTLEAYRYWSSDPITWRPVWFRDVFEAQNAANVAAQKFIENLAAAKAEKVRLEAEARAQAELDTAKSEAQAARDELKALQSAPEWWSLDQELRSKVEGRTGYYVYLPSTTAELEAWTVETKTITAEVKTAIDQVKAEREESDRLAREAQEREDAAEKERLSVLLAHEIWGTRISFEKAKQVDAFVQQVFKIMRPSNAAAVLKIEAERQYGRGGRTEALYNAFGDNLSMYGLDWAAGRDIEPVAFWAGYLAGTGKAASQPTPAVDAPAPTPTVTFTEETKRYFRCSNGGSHRLTASEYQAYQAGTLTVVKCSLCGHHGTLPTKATVASAEQKSTSTASSTEDMMAALKAKFGGR